MNQLSDTQLERITHYIQQTSVQQALQPELVDHVASLVEKRMNEGHDFSAAFEQVMQQANPQALAQLKKLYQQENPIRAALTTSLGSRMGTRARYRSGTQPLYYSLLVGVFAFLVLMGGLILISRTMSIPLAMARLAWVAGGASALSVLVARRLLPTRPRKAKFLFAS